MAKKNKVSGCFTGIVKFFFFGYLAIMIFGALIGGITSLFSDDTENIRYTGEFVSELSSKNDNIAVEILPYHELGKDKYQWLNIKYEIDNTVKPDKVSVEECKTLLKELGCRVI